MLKKENQPLTPNDLRLAVAVIMDGKILDEPLSNAGRSRGWLLTEVGKMGVTLKDVFLGQINSYGELTVDLYDDKLQVPSPQERPLILATMKQCQADTETFALAAENEEAKKHEKNSEKLKKKLTVF